MLLIGWQVICDVVCELLNAQRSHRSDPLVGTVTVVETMTDTVTVTVIKKVTLTKAMTVIFFQLLLAIQFIKVIFYFTTRLVCY